MMFHQRAGNKSFLFLIIFCNFDVKLSQIFTGLLFYAFVGIYKMRTLVFDNYQKYTLPLRSNPYIPNGVDSKSKLTVPARAYAITSRGEAK